MTTTAPRATTADDHHDDDDTDVFITDLLHRRGPHRPPVLPALARRVRLRVRAALPPTEATIDVLGRGQLSALALSCAGPGELDRRDEALVRVLAATAQHHRSVRTLRPGDVDLVRARLVLVPHGEGRTRFVPLGDNTVRALTRHLAQLPPGQHVLWAGTWGAALTDRELRCILDHRSGLAGLGPVLPTSLRRSALARWVTGGGSPEGFVALHGAYPSDALARGVVPSTHTRALAEARRVDLDSF